MGRLKKDVKKVWRSNMKIYVDADACPVIKIIERIGKKGYCYEGKDSIEHFFKIRDREIARLRDSFEQAREAGYKKYIMFLHYPPTSIGEMESPFTRMAEEYEAKKVIYSHCHGKARFDDSFKEYVNGVEYRLVSGDYLKFKPELILK